MPGKRFIWFVGLFYLAGCASSLTTEQSLAPPQQTQMPALQRSAAPQPRPVAGAAPAMRAAASPVAPETTPRPDDAPAPQPTPTPQEEPAPQRVPPERRLLPPPSAAGGGDLVSLNFSRADLVEIIHILAQHLKLTYTIDPEVKGTVTIHSAEPLRREDLLPIFHQVLRMNGAVAVRSGNIYRIMLIKDAKGVARPAGQSREDGFALQVVPVRFFSVAEMKKLLTPFLMPGGEIIEYPRGNFLIIVDLPSNIQRLAEIADLIDVQVFAGSRMEIYQPKIASAEELAAEMTKIMQSFAASAPQVETFTAQFIPIPRINQLLVISHSDAAWTYAKRWLERIDVIAEGPGRRIFVYPVENGKATELADVLSQALGLPSAGRRETTRTLQDLHRSSPSGTGLSIGSRPSTSMTGPSGLGTQQGPPYGAFATVPAPGQPAAPPPPVAAAPGAPRPPVPPAAAARPEEQLRIVPDPATNTLIIYGTTQEFQNIRNILKELDIMPRQVMLDVLVAEVTLTDDETFGVEYEILRRGGDVRIFDREFSSRGGVLSGLLNSLDAASTTTGLSSFPSGVSGVIGTGNAVRAFINALKSDSRAKILSSPTVLATDNRPARIQVGSEEPVATGTITGAVGTVASSTTIQYRNTGRIVTIIPQVNSLGLVNLQILAEVSQRGANVLVGSDSFPSFDTRQAETTAVVQDGETLAIGGIITDDKTRSRTGIPYLMDIPIIGRFFGTTSDEATRTELIMLITPRVIRSVPEARYATEEFKYKLSQLRNELERLEKERAKAKPPPPPEPQPDAPEPSPAPSSRAPGSSTNQEKSGAPPQRISLPLPLAQGPSQDSELAKTETVKREPAAPVQRAEIVIPGSGGLEAEKPVPLPSEAYVAPAAVKIETHRPAGAAAGKPPPQSAKPTQQWMVQVASFALEKDAENLANQLRQKGYDTYVITADIAAKTWYRVRVGRLSKREEALELQQKLKALEKFEESVLFTH
ncbi:MAG: type II secretion system secretin GspD [Candidatus Binatia bacterium]